MKKTALFPGTFDPFTIGHDAIVRRALTIADKVIIALGKNRDKEIFYPMEERFEKIRSLYSNEPRVTVSHYKSLTIDFAKVVKADFILRGIRSIKDFEYEKNIAEANRKLSGIETVFLFAEPQYEYISSSLIRELAYYGKDISHLIPTKK